MTSFNYHLENIHNRLEILLLVLQYDSENPQLSVSERIQINQERGAMFDYKNYLFREMKFEDVRMLKVSQNLENKIIKIANEIQKTNWEPKPYDNDNQY